MSKVTDKLRLMKIYNPYNFAKHGRANIYVTYEPQGTGRFTWSAQYSVIGIGFNVDPESAWYDYGRKVFTVFHYGGDKRKAREEALAWAAEKFLIKAWAKMPFRESWVDREAYDRVMAELKGVTG